MGRIMLILFFVGYCLLYPWNYFNIPAAAVDERRSFVGFILVNLLWTGVLFGAIWTGHGWARYLFLFVLLGEIYRWMPFFLDIESVMEGLSPAFWLLNALHVTVLVCFMCSQPIRALTRK